MRSAASDTYPTGAWHITDMEMWDEDYFNMETQAYIQIEGDGHGDFQFGLVTGSIDGYVEKMASERRFTFNWKVRIRSVR